jgi:hypothetical protein
MKAAIVGTTVLAILLGIGAIVAFIINFRQIEDASRFLGIAAFGFAILAVVLLRSRS